jgi:hypothetical protein
MIKHVITRVNPENNEKVAGFYGYSSGQLA